ncbi:hypothetical protein BKA80DRAFT_341014 [Phyllosticta citrichinensis]
MAPASTVLPASFNAYRILSLPPPRQTASRPPSPADIKAAYRRALLTHHPDKAGALNDTNNVDTDARSDGGARNRKAAGSSTTPAFSVDDITLAYKTLSSPAERAAHDRALRLSNNGDGKGKADAETHAEEQFRLGLEVWDLDELAWDEAQGAWWRGCRCGEERGFVVHERDLERALESAILDLHFSPTPKASSLGRRRSSGPPTM